MFAFCMKHFLSSLLVAAFPFFLYGQAPSCDVFLPIGKYLEAGDAESLSAWFAPNLEVSVLGDSHDASRNQAKQIVKTFFKSHSPSSFTISHQAGRENLRCAIGMLEDDKENFLVTIFISKPEGEGFQIQQLKIDKAR